MTEQETARGTRPAHRVADLGLQLAHPRMVGLQRFCETGVFDLILGQ